MIICPCVVVDAEICPSKNQSRGKIMAENDNTTAEQTAAEPEATETTEPVAQDAETTDDAAESGEVESTTVEEPKETPAQAKPVRVSRTRKAAAAQQANDSKTEPKEAAKRGRPKAARPDPGKDRKSSEVPQDIIDAGRFPSYSGNTTRVKERLADLRENPVRTGSSVNPKLIFTDTKWGQFETASWKRTDFPLEKDLKIIYFLGTDKQGNLDWMIGTKGDAIVRLRETKTGEMRVSTVSLADIEKFYNLGVWFNDNDFRIWNLDTEWVQYNLGVKAEEERKAAAQRAAARKAAAQPKKQPVKATAPKPAAPKKTRIVAKRRATASK